MSAEGMTNGATAPRGGSHDDDQKFPYGFGIFLMVGLLMCAFAFLPRIFRAHEAVSTGKAAPDFAMTFVANKPETPQLALSQYKGKAVILDFWATWCGPCKAQSPVLDRLAQRYADRGVVVLGVNTSDEPGNAEEWIRQHKISYPIAFDAGEAARLYGVVNLPTLVIVSRDGKIAAVREGFTDATELESLIKRVL
jgi:cytochrome c biogenesis protein CcmG/thiol:disulfide interchange protein DsbE